MCAALANGQDHPLRVEYETEALRSINDRLGALISICCLLVLASPLRLLPKILFRIRKWRRSGNNLDRLGPDWVLDCYTSDLMKDHTYKKLDREANE